MMKARRSTSGSTETPRSAFSLTTVSLSSTRFAGSGSGLCAKSPVGLQLRPIHLTPRRLRSLGIMMPPTEFTASTTTVNFAALMASTSTAGRARTASRCLSVKSSSSIWPRLSTSAKLKSSFSARSRTAWPSIAVRNSPLSLRSLRAFHCLGLWLAVRMIPPSALANSTAISVVGVDAKPHFTTSIPQPMRVPTTSCSTISPDIRASLPTTIL